MMNFDLQYKTPSINELYGIGKKLEAYYQRDIEFQQQFMRLISEMLTNQQLTTEAFKKLDSFIRKEFFWNSYLSRHPNNQK